MLCSQGRQEDAEEYLGFTLNGLHEEMLSLKKLLSPHEDSACLSVIRCQWNVEVARCHRESLNYLTTNWHSGYCQYIMDYFIYTNPEGQSMS